MKKTLCKNQVQAILRLWNSEFLWVSGKRSCRFSNLETGAFRLFLVNWSPVHILVHRNITHNKDYWMISWMPSSKGTISRDWQGKLGAQQGFPQIKLFLQLEIFQSFWEEIKWPRKSTKKYFSPSQKQRICLLIKQQLCLIMKLFWS